MTDLSDVVACGCLPYRCERHLPVVESCDPKDCDHAWWAVQGKIGALCCMACGAGLAAA